MTSVRLKARRPWRRIAAVGALGLAGLGALVALDLTGRQPPPPPLPVPNGYDTIVRAGKLIAGQPPDPAKADAAALRAFVKPNEEALKLATRALGEPFRVPVGGSQAALQASMDNVGPIRQLGRLLIAEGMLAEREGRRGAALIAYLNAVRLGPLSAHGGFVIHELAGFAVQTPALRGLGRLREALDGSQCRGLVATLEAVDSIMDAPASVIARERAWFRTTADWRMRIGMIANPAVGRTLDALAKPAYQAYEAASRRTLLQLRQIRALAAVRAYRLEVGVDPPGLKALVPRYLSAVPLDPGDGKPLVYRDEPGEGLRVDDAPADEAGDQIPK